MNNLANTGYAEEVSPRTANLMWNRTVGNIESGCAIYNNFVYVTTTNTQAVYALNLETGEVIWSTPIGRTMRCVPAIADGKVFVADESGYIICLNASDGSVIWEIQLSSQSISRAHPKVVGGMVLIGCYDGYLYALNASPVNMPLENRIIWKFKTGGQIRGAPAIVDGKVYIGSNDDYIYCISLSSGEEIWRFKTGGDIRGSPTVAYGKVYVGSFDCYVYAFDMNTGRMIWNFTTGNRVSGTPAAAYGKIYIGSQDNWIYCLDAETGALKWKFETKGLEYNSPAVANGLVYMGSKDKSIYCLNAETGELVWKYETGGEIRGAPAIVNGILVVGSFGDGNVYAFSDVPAINKTLVVEVLWSDGSGIAGTEVTVNSKSALTNSSGIVTFTLPIGSYNLTVKHNGLLLVSRSIDLNDNMKITINVPKKITLNVEVLWTDGSGVSEAMVEIDSLSAFTNTSGKATFSLDPGLYNLTIKYLGFTLESRIIELTKDTTIGVIKDKGPFELIVSLRNQVAYLESERKTLEEQVNSLTSQVNSLNNQIDSLNSQIKSLQSQVANNLYMGLGAGIVIGLIVGIGIGLLMFKKPSLPSTP